MKIIRVNLNEERNEIVQDIILKPISDVHLGDKLCNLKALKKVLQEIKDEPNISPYGDM